MGQFMRTFFGCVHLAIATLLLTSAAWSQSPVKGKAKGERPQEGKLQPGDEAPNFKLKRLNADEELELASFRGKRPVVLVFGSYT
jgi:hypothetical protein